MYGVHILNVDATRQSEDSSCACFSPLSYLDQWWVIATLFWNWGNLDLRGQVRDCFVTCVVFFSVRSSGCLLLFAVLDPDEQEVVVEVPRVVQNPPKPVMTTRPTAVKATGIVVCVCFFFNSLSTISFFRIKLCLYMVFWWMFRQIYTPVKWKFNIFVRGCSCTYVRV